MAVPVALYVPNLIGYARVVFAFFAWHVAFTDHVMFFAWYGLSMGLDAVDGVAARALGQTSKFGAVLDMVTDRISTASLLVILGHIYPAHEGVFTKLMVLDVGSHWVHMYATLLLGGGSHKDKAANPNALLRFYYTFPYALLVLCVMSEGFLLFLYTWYHTPGPQMPAALSAMLSPFGASATLHFVPVAIWVCAPFFFLKQAISVVQGWDAFARIAAADTREREALAKGAAKAHAS